MSTENIQQVTATGDFHTLANLSQTLNTIIIRHYMGTHPQQEMPQFMLEGIHMICHTLAKAVNNDIYDKSHWSAIANYALILEDIIYKAAVHAAQQQDEEQQTEITNEENSND